MSIEENKKLVAEFFACFGRKDVDGAMSMMTDDATWWIGGKKRLFPIAGLKTKAEAKDIFDAFVPTSKDGLEIIPTGMVAEGDKVAVEAKSHGEFPSGFVYENEYHFLVTLRDGKVASVKEFLDTMHTAEFLAAEA
ncbi:MAG: nuclear transport factor 2 family protein [Porticoccaceae bacterium]|nr:nuclear transport factor 2 family protein [Pseudomonadales bacterium]MCP5172942.1 nuclear transport factor 2 family protein [Pseudomonadales bacterium]MCP5302415.1 nuclear transport factor 2 family protein [Pseudomonadales bacterium]